MEARRAAEEAATFAAATDVLSSRSLSFQPPRLFSSVLSWLRYRPGHCGRCEGRERRSERRRERRRERQSVRHAAVVLGGGGTIGC